MFLTVDHRVVTVGPTGGLTVVSVLGMGMFSWTCQAWAYADGLDVLGPG